MLQMRYALFAVAQDLGDCPKEALPTRGLYPPNGRVEGAVHAVAYGLPWDSPQGATDSPAHGDRCFAPYGIKSTVFASFQVSPPSGDIMRARRLPRRSVR